MPGHKGGCGWALRKERNEAKEGQACGRAGHGLQTIF